ncbi:MAG: hypothetical protein CK429_22795 [Mycobacterium sp.]|nr:MAG: hypothetical protein CK429_22795 [Mycobacterium sp.]
MLADSDQARAVAVNVADEDSVVAACAEMVENIGVPWLLINDAAQQDREPLLRSPVRLPGAIRDRCRGTVFRLTCGPPDHQPGAGRRRQIFGELRVWRPASARGGIGV